MLVKRTSKGRKLRQDLPSLLLEKKKLMLKSRKKLERANRRCEMLQQKLDSLSMDREDEDLMKTVKKIKEKAKNDDVHSCFLFDQVS